MVDIVVNRHELRATLIRIVDLLRNRRPPGELVTLGDAEEAAAQAKPARTAVAKAFAAKAKANKEKETSAE